MGMRKKPVQKPMIGTVNKPKPATPAPQEPNKAGGLGESIADQVSSGKLDKRTLPMLPPSETNRLLPGGGLVPSPGSSGSSESNPSFARLRNTLNPPTEPAVTPPPMGEIASSRQGINPPAQPSFRLDKFGNKQPINPTLNLPDSMRRENRPPVQKPDALGISAEQMNEAVERENQIQQSLIDQGVNPNTPVSQNYIKPVLAPAPSNRLLPGGGLVPNEPLPARTISPLQQLGQNKQKMYQTQPASQQMQAPEAEPMPPASQQMQSEQPEQQAPAQDSSAIDAQIAQLQQQIAQLQAQKK